MMNEEKINALRGIIGKYELSDTERQAVESAISEIQKADKYRWHDLRKNPEDLPEIGTHIVYLFKEGRFGLTHSNTCRYIENMLNNCDDFKYIAWKEYGFEEIEPFEEG